MQNDTKQKHIHNQNIIMPQIISKELDIFMIEEFKSRANYITTKKAIGEVIEIKNTNDSNEITGKIVMIESADPGFDWIFTHNIKGLITKYGGAASHMAIRSSEFNLPAAIGVGKDYHKLKSCKNLILDCENKLINQS